MISNQEFEASCRQWKIETAEQQIASWIRQLSAPSDSAQRTLENTLLRLQLALAALDPADPFPVDGVHDLPAVLLARSLGNIAKQTDQDEGIYSSLAATTFAAAGNFATASVVAKESLRASTNLGEFEKWILGILAHPTKQFSAQAPKLFKAYARLTDNALDTGLSATFTEARAELLRVFKKASDSLSTHAKYLALLWEKVHDRYTEFSTARILSEHGFNHPAYFKQLRATSSATLFPTQIKAITTHSLLQNSKNALILLPTSTGKSLLGELALIKSLTESPNRPLAVYLAPYRALADQLVRKMKPRLKGIGLDCEVLRGGYLSNSLYIIWEKKPTVLVATPEAFDSLVRAHPELYLQIACCVFDEFHLIEQYTRGLSYEGLVARFLSLPTIQQPRILALSPVITETQALTRWLDVPADSVVSSSWRPTGRRLAIAGPDRAIRYYAPGEYSSSTPGNTPRPAWIGSTQFPHPILKAPGKHEPYKLRDHDKHVRTNIATVAIEQYRKFENPVLVIATSRADTRRIAAQITQQLSSDQVHAAAQELATTISKRYPNLKTLKDCLLRGVAYHNASLPNWVRERLEDIIERAQLRIVVSTTTLAEGVDLPFRVVVLSGWRSFQFGSPTAIPIPSLLFRNIAGRCGRAGAFAEGDTVIVDNPHRTELSYRERLLEYEQLYIKPGKVELQPASIRALSAEDTAILSEIKPSLDSQFAAFLQLAPAEADHAELFASCLFASQDTIAKSKLLTAVNSIVEESLGVEDYPTLQRNSPLQLTNFGLKVLPSGISGRSASKLALFYANYTPSSDPAKGRKLRKNLGATWNPLLGALLARLQQGDFVKELETGDYKRIDRHGFPVKSGNIADILMAWASGCSIADLSLALERNKETRQSAETWLKGQSLTPIESFEEDFEQISVFCTSYFSQQWSWILRASVLIAEHLQLIDLGQELESLSQQLEYGVGDPISVQLLLHGCPVDRSIVSYVVTRCRQESQDHALNMTILEEWVATNEATLLGTRPGAFEIKAIDEEELSAIRGLAQTLIEFGL